MHPPGPPPHPDMTAHPGRTPPPHDDHQAFFAVFGVPRVQRGDSVRVEIDREANVLLVDDTGLDAYRAHRPFHYVGGGYPKGRTVLGVPADGNWHVVIDLGGREGTVHATVAVHRNAPDGQVQR